MRKKMKKISAILLAFAMTASCWQAAAASRQMRVQSRRKVNLQTCA